MIYYISCNSSLRGYRVLEINLDDIPFDPEGKFNIYGIILSDLVQVMTDGLKSNTTFINFI